jgi:hypothetical protein
MITFSCRVGQIFEFVESIGVMLRSFFRQAQPATGINKDPTFWLVGARPPPLSKFAKIIWVWRTWKFDQLGPSAMSSSIELISAPKLLFFGQKSWRHHWKFHFESTPEKLKTLMQLNHWPQQTVWKQTLPSNGKESTVNRALGGSTYPS